MASGPTILARFLADTSQMTGEVDKATSGASSKLESFGKKAALAIGGAFAVGAIVDFGKESVAAAAADAEAQAQLAASLKNTTGATDAQIASTEAYISSLSKQTAIADDDLRPAMADLARGFGDTEEAQKALALATDISAGTGKDLASVSQALMKAAQGNTGALGKMGIATKDASGKALTLDEIMANAAQTFKGQAATAAESTAGKMRGAEIAMGELQETIGNALLPVLGTLATVLTGTILPAVTSVFGWIMDHKDLVIAALVAVAVVITGTLGPAFVVWAAGAAAAAAATIVAAAPFIALGAVIAGVAYLIIHNWDTIVDAAKATWDAVTKAVRAAFDWVKDNWPLLLAIITGPIGAAVLIVVRNWDSIKAAAVAVWDWINSTWSSLVGIISGPIQSAKDLVVNAWHAIQDAATAAYDWIKGKFDAIGGAIESVVGGITTAVGKVVSAIKGPINAVIGAWNNLSFTIPAVSTPKIHVPGTNVDFGGEIYGGHTFDFPNLPTLAAGGVLTRPTLFVGGEAGTEIVSPEDLLRQIMREEGGGRYTLNIYPRTADASDIAYGFRRLELLAGLP
jgi:hypothetical protein